MWKQARQQSACKRLVLYKRLVLHLLLELAKPATSASLCTCRLRGLTYVSLGPCLCLPRILPADCSSSLILTSDVNCCSRDFSTKAKSFKIQDSTFTKAAPVLPPLMPQSKEDDFSCWISPMDNPSESLHAWQLTANQRCR